MSRLMESETDKLQEKEAGSSEKYGKIIINPLGISRTLGRGLWIKATWPGSLRTGHSSRQPGHCRSATPITIIDENKKSRLGIAVKCHNIVKPTSDTGETRTGASAREPTGSSNLSWSTFGAREFCAAGAILSIVACVLASLASPH